MSTVNLDAERAVAAGRVWACARFRCAVFGSSVLPGAPTAGREFLRKDYGYLFERFCHFLDQRHPGEERIVAFDELERSRSHLLINRMQSYFLGTQVGRMRSGLVMPEPLFVHSDLTTGVKVADLVAYIVSWNVRFAGLALGRREELDARGDLGLDEDAAPHWPYLRLVA